ncbi:MAG TPA: TlpA disulfide reductase family protein [Segetibacter sp.]|jgi:peroxiredoxin
MKTSLSVAFLLLFSAAFGQEKPFTINGTVKGDIPAIQKVYLSYRSNGVSVSDSTTVKNGKYSFKGKLVEPVKAQIVAKPASAGDTAGWRAPRRDVALLFLGPNKIEVTSVDSFRNATIKGSLANDELAKIDALLKPINDKSAELNKQYFEFDKVKDEAGKAKTITALRALNKDSRNVYAEYLKANPSSPLAIYALNQYAGYDINADEVDPFFNALPESVKGYPSYKDLNDRLVIARKIGVGKQAMDFTQNDTLGNPVSLASFKGKYVLVDFWASWCGPCRKENPNVVSAFNKYKDKDFTVLGVSLDQPGAQARWVKAIHDDKLTWTHVSDLNYWDNAVAKQYGIRAIPFNLLLDKEGKIVAKNITGEALQTKLAEILE